MNLKDLLRRTFFSTGPVLGILAMTNFIGVTKGNGYELILIDKASRIPGCEIKDIRTMNYEDMEKLFQNMREIKEIYEKTWSFLPPKEKTILIFESETGKIIQCRGDEAIKKLLSTYIQPHPSNLNILNPITTPIQIFLTKQEKNFAQQKIQ